MSRLQPYEIANAYRDQTVMAADVAEAAESSWADAEEEAYWQSLLEHVDMELAEQEPEVLPLRWGCCGNVVGHGHLPTCYAGRRG